MDSMNRNTNQPSILAFFSKHDDGAPTPSGRRRPMPPTTRWEPPTEPSPEILDLIGGTTRYRNRSMYLKTAATRGTGDVVGMARA